MGSFATKYKPFQKKSPFCCLNSNRISPSRQRPPQSAPCTAANLVLASANSTRPGVTKTRHNNEEAQSPDKKLEVARAERLLVEVNANTSPAPRPAPLRGGLCESRFHAPLFQEILRADP